MTPSTKRKLAWAIAALIVLALAGGVLRTLSARKAKQDTLAASSVVKEQGMVELAATDVATAKTRTLVQGLPVSGTLRAVNSAVIKARVAGELMGLTVREGDYVKAGQVIARIDAAEYQSRVRQMREQAESAKAQVDVVQRQYDNNKALVDQGFISKTALDTSLANLNAAQSTYRSAQAGTDVANKSLEDTVLKAPISGQVSQRLAQPGERVGIDTRIIEIVDLSRLELEATLSATDSMSVKVGQAAQLKIEGSARPVNATVVRINPSAQAGSRNVLAYLSIDNNANATPASGVSAPLRQGLFAQGALGAAGVPLLSVPVSAVRTDKPLPYVQTVESGQIVQKAVTTGAQGIADGEAVMAVQGLTEGAIVVRGNINALREGTKVQFTTAAPAGKASTSKAP